MGDIFYSIIPTRIFGKHFGISPTELLTFVHLLIYRSTMNSFSFFHYPSIFGLLICIEIN